MSLSIDVFYPPPSVPAVQELQLAPSDTGPVMVISHGFSYMVTGNTLLPERVIRAALENAESPKRAVENLQAAYNKAGYFLVALRAQVKDHEVTLQVIEGQITRVEAQPELKRFYDGVEFDPSLQENDLVRRNIIAEAYATRSGLAFRPSVAPGQQPGGTTLTVSTPAQTDFKPISGSVVLGNYGSRYVGGVMLGENLTIHPGGGLEMTFGYAHGLPNALKDSTGSRYDAANAAASVVTPWGIYGMTYSRSAYRVGLAAAPLYPTGETQTWGLTASQLIYGSPTVRLTTTQGLTHVSNITTVFQNLYTLTDQNYNYASLGLQINKNTAFGGLSGAINVSIAYNAGLSGPIGTLTKTTPGLPVSRFRYWSLASNWQQGLEEGWSINLALNGQWSLDTLPQNQQWVLGGYGSLSAWAPGVLVGDGGYLVRAILQTPNLQWRGWQFYAQSFIEQGAATSHYKPIGTAGWQMLADMGLGLTWRSPWKSTFSLLAARPIGSKNVNPPTLRNQRSIYFILQQNF